MSVALKQFEKRDPVPAKAGAGLKAEHVDEILRSRPQVGFFEVHAENYMGDGGLPHRQLSSIRDTYAISMHGVGLSIGGEDPLNKDHLARLKRLQDRYEPALFSEHLAWSSHGENYYNDLLPVPYNSAVLERVCDHIDELQEVLGRSILLENPSTYVAFEQSTMSEIDFLSAIVQRTGCWLLLDVNNVYVSATNQQTDPDDYLDAFPIAHVGEIHLAGHAQDQDEAGRLLLIDSHDRAVDDAVWGLYERLIARTGLIPTLVEWDGDIPAWPVLKDEMDKANALMVRPRARHQPQERVAVPA
ncbi:MAG: DUF692 domain-containing protein [Ahrensia sp.]|nr:DUF692 domain-containing protein [Ahrensia sp.]